LPKRNFPKKLLMATITAGTEIFSNNDRTIIFEDTNFPSQFIPIRQFYGDGSGSATSQIYPVGERVGIATNKPQQVIGGKTYQHVSFTRIDRHEPGFNLGSLIPVYGIIATIQGLGPGTYTQSIGGAWILVDNILTDSKEAEQLAKDRLDPSAKKKREDAARLKEITDKPNKDTMGNGTGDKKSGAGIWIALIAFFALVGTGLALWKKKRNAKREMAMQQANSSPYPPSQSQYKTTRL
jgi:hypothetical protein